MRNPDEAAHVIGKLLKHLGPDNILYGSDCVWYGSPQDQIEAFRSFQIAESWQERYGYPALTDGIRAKIFGLNGARVYGIDHAQLIKRARKDRIADARENYREDPAPHHQTYGPKTRREYLQLLRLSGQPDFSA